MLRRSIYFETGERKCGIQLQMLSTLKFYTSGFLPLKAHTFAPPTLDITLWHNWIIYDKGDIGNTTSGSRQDMFKWEHPILLYSIKSV
jgi:hypothetical protein